MEGMLAILSGILLLYSSAYFSMRRRETHGPKGRGPKGRGPYGPCSRSKSDSDLDNLDDSPDSDDSHDSDDSDDSHNSSDSDDDSETQDDSTSVLPTKRGWIHRVLIALITFGAIIKILTYLLPPPRLHVHTRVDIIQLHPSLQEFAAACDEIVTAVEVGPWDTRAAFLLAEPSGSSHILATEDGKMPIAQLLRELWSIIFELTNFDRRLTDKALSNAGLAHTPPALLDTAQAVQDAWRKVTRAHQAPISSVGSALWKLGLDSILPTYFPKGPLLNAWLPTHLNMTLHKITKDIAEARRDLSALIVSIGPIIDFSVASFAPENSSICDAGSEFRATRTTRDWDGRVEYPDIEVATALRCILRTVQPGLGALVNSASRMLAALTAVEEARLRPLRQALRQLITHELPKGYEFSFEPESDPCSPDSVPTLIGSPRPDGAWVVQREEEGEIITTAYFFPPAKCIDTLFEALESRIKSTKRAIAARKEAAASTHHEWRRAVLQGRLPHCSYTWGGVEPWANDLLPRVPSNIDPALAARVLGRINENVQATRAEYFRKKENGELDVPEIEAI